MAPENGMKDWFKHPTEKWWEPKNRNKEKKHLKEKEKLFVEKGKEIKELTNETQSELSDFSKEQLKSILPLIDDDNILNTFEWEAKLFQFRKYRQMRATDMLEFGGSLGLWTLLLTIQKDIGEPKFVANIVKLYNDTNGAWSLKSTDLKGLSAEMGNKSVQEKWFKLVRMFSGRINNLLRDGINDISIVDLPKSSDATIDISKNTQSIILSPEQLWVYQAWFRRFVEANKDQIGLKSQDFVDNNPDLSKKDIKKLTDKINGDVTLDQSQKNQLLQILSQKAEKVSHALHLQGLFLWYIQDKLTTTTNTSYETVTETIIKEVRINPDGSMTIIKDNSNDLSRFSEPKADTNADGTPKITTTVEKQVTDLLSLWAQYGIQLTRTMQWFVGVGGWVGIADGNIVGAGGSIYTWVSQQIYKSLSTSLTGVLWFVQWGLTTGAALWLNWSPKLNKSEKSGRAQVNLVTGIGAWADINGDWITKWVYLWASFDKMWGINGFVDRMEHVLHTTFTDYLVDIKKPEAYLMADFAKKLEKSFDSTTSLDLATRLGDMIKVSNLSSLSDLLNKEKLTDLKKWVMDDALMRWFMEPLIANIATERRQDTKKVSFGGVVVSWSEIAAAIASGGATIGASALKMVIWSGKLSSVDTASKTSTTQWVEIFDYNKDQIDTIVTTVSTLVWSEAKVSFDQAQWYFIVQLGDQIIVIEGGSSIEFVVGKLNVVKDVALKSNEIKIIEPIINNTATSTIPFDWSYSSELAPVQFNIANVDCKKTYNTFESMSAAIIAQLDSMKWPTISTKEVLQSKRHPIIKDALTAIDKLQIASTTKIPSKEDLKKMLTTPEAYNKQYSEILPQLHLLLLASFAQDNDTNHIYELYNQLLRYETVMGGTFLNKPTRDNVLWVYERGWAKHHKRLVNEFGEDTTEYLSMHNTNEAFIKEMKQHDYQWYAQVDKSEVTWFTWHFNSLKQNPKATYGKTALETNTFITQWNPKDKSSFEKQFVNIKLSWDVESYAKEWIKSNTTFASDFAQKQLNKIIIGLKNYKLSEVDKSSILTSIKTNFFDKKGDVWTSSVMLADGSKMKLDMSQSAYYMVGNHQCGSNQTFVYVPKLTIIIGEETVDTDISNKPNFNILAFDGKKKSASYSEKALRTSGSSTNIAGAFGKTMRNAIINEKKRKIDTTWDITTHIDVETFTIETVPTIKQDGKEWVVKIEAGKTYLVEVKTDSKGIVTVVAGGIVYEVEIKSGTTYQVIFQGARPKPIDAATKQVVTWNTSQDIFNTQRPKPIITTTTTKDGIPPVVWTYKSEGESQYIRQKISPTVTISNLSQALSH